MKKRILIFFAMGLSLLVLQGCHKKETRKVLDQVQENQQIIWGVKNDTRLFGLHNIAKNEIEGFDIDIAKEITKRIIGEKGKASFVEVTSKTRIPLLKNGNIDAIIATMTISDERKKVVDFSEPYFLAGQALLVKKGSPIHSVEDLNGNHTVLAVKGSTSAINIRKFAPDAKINELESYAEAFTALQARQGDAMTTDNAILLGIADENPDYEVVGETFTDEPYGIAVDKNQQDFLNAVNTALYEMKQDGTYDMIYQKWFKTTDNKK